jgi:hypothetical protein
LTEYFDQATLTSTFPATDWIDEIDVTNHPITACVLNIAGCGGTYAAAKFTLPGPSPWDIIIDRNFPLGYTDTFCVSCTNNLMTHNFGDFIYILTPTIEK